MTDALLPYQPSLGSVTGTRVDTSCRHNQQCRISTDDMLLFTIPQRDQDELQRNKYRYCVHKDEFVVGIGRPWKPTDTRKRANNAYPRVISNLGALQMSNDGKYILRMIRYMNHYARNIQERKLIIDWFEDNESAESILGKKKVTDVAFGKDDKEQLSKYLHMITDQLPVGYANTLGWSHPKNGDTMVTVNIGGLRTVQNGDFEVFTGDIIQWYWPFELDCFKTNGERKPYADAWNGDTPPNIDPAFDVEQHKKTSFNTKALDPAADTRMDFAARQFGQPADRPKVVARIKPYFRDDEDPRLYDSYRVFAVAISCARPHEPVDIKISRQSV